MKSRTKRSIVFLFMIIFMMGVLINLNSKDTNLHYNQKHEDTSLKSSDNEIIIHTPENITYTEPMSGYYPATYGFDNDLPGSEPSGWDILQPDGTGFIEVDAIHAGHKNVVELRKTGGTTKASLSKSFPDNARAGTIEYWLYKDTDSGIDPTRMGLFGEGGSLQFGIQSGDLYRGPFGGPTIASNVFTVNMWHHIRVDFNLSLGWQIQLDDTWYGSGYSLPFEETPTKLYSFGISSIFSGDHPNYGAWLDALDYSWHINYAIGDNLNEGLLLSYDNSTNLEWQGYSLDGQSNKTIYGNTTISMPVDGLHQVQVFGNDSLGMMYESELQSFIVNMIPIDITINSPTNYEVFQDIAPNFDISIDDPDLNSTWYSLDDGITNISFTGLTGIIEQSEWNKFSNGTVTIVFYANDSVNYINHASVIVRKDVLGPIITVNSPQDDDIFGINAPNYELSIAEFNLDSIWYSLDYGVTVKPLYSLTGNLDQTEWETKSDGTIPIRFYANDSFGQESFTDVTVIKDITLPLITINSPGVEEIFGDSPPDYDISITEPNLDSYWYTLDGGATNVSISSFTGIIDQTEWNKHGNGTITLTFFARDEGGNEGFTEIIVRKEIIAPTITINSPLLNEIYSGNSPSYSVIINDSNLDSYWYTLDGGAINISISSFTGIIDQTEWNKHGNGTITIKFFANDTLGNENYQEVTIRKDVSAPIITIDSPVLNDIVGHNPPNYEITVIDSQLDSMWYTIDNGLINTTITNKTGTIDQTEWEKNQGVNILIKFYANDTLGNTAYSEVAIIKNVLHGIDYIELLTPSTNSRIFSNLLDFSWSSLDIGVNFTLQVSNMSDFSHIVFQSENIAETPTVTNFSVPLSIIQGQYYWRVRSTYGNYIGNWSDYFSFTLHINDYSPNLALDDFSPTTGTKDTIFRFTVIYSDLDNNAPEYVKILINEISYFMEKLNPSDIDFTDGCIYQFITLLTPSTTNYTISFECSDGAFQYSTSTYQGPLVESGSTPSNNQGDNNLFSTNIFAITIIFGITIGSIIPSIVIVEKKVRKMKLGEKTSTKIKKKTIKS